MSVSLGNQWFTAMTAANVKKRDDRVQEAAWRGQDESDAAIKAIPDLVAEAGAKGKGSIRVLPRKLEAKDVSYGMLKELYACDARSRYRDGLRPEYLLGAARTIVEWCVKNGMVCHVKRKGPRGKRSYWLKAKPRPTPTAIP